MALTTGSSFLGCMFLLRIVVWEPCVHVVPDLWVCGLENSQVSGEKQPVPLACLDPFSPSVGVRTWSDSFSLCLSGSKGSLLPMLANSALTTSS